MRRLFIKLHIIFWISFGYSQYPAGHIPSSNRQEWAKAGLQDKSMFKLAAKSINFKTDTLGGVGENDEKIKNILENLSGDVLTIIYFPEGEYTFYEPIIINKDNVVLQGAGSEKTKLYFENAKSDPCIKIIGSNFGSSSDIEGSVYKGSKRLTPRSNIPSIKDKWIHFFEQESGYGQITKVVDVGPAPTLGKTKKLILTLKDKATKSYITGDLKVAAFKPRQNVGIENLKIQKITKGKGDGGSSVYFIRAVNSWVRGVESAYTSEHHIRLNYSSHIEISGNYLHHSQYYGQGGYGYGVNVQANTTNSLVENNILKHLRHSIAVQKGANCNVINYNYSHDRRSFNDDIFSPENESCDLVLHGNYPWGNLFEQNNVAAIAADNTHGKNGPYNVFLRNKARADGIIALEPGWYPYEYGLVIYKAPETSLLGNIIKNKDIDYNSNDLAVDIFGSDTNGDDDDNVNIRHKGSTYNKAKNNPNAYFMNDESYYYNERPAFLPDEYTYPSIGPKPSSGIELTQNIPARGRVKNDLIKTFNNNPTVWSVELTLITKTDESIDTTSYNLFSFQPFKVADSLTHPTSGEKYFFAGIEENEFLDFDEVNNEILPDLFAENVFTIVYKKIQRSSYKDAYSSNNQRKFVKATDGSLYNIYESMGHIFLETKTKSENWALLSENNVNLFLDTHGGKSPAIDYAKKDNNYNNLLGITYQQGNEILVNTLLNENDRITFGPKLSPITTEIEENTNLSPNIAWGGQGIFMVLWEDSTVNLGINYSMYQLSDSFVQIDTGIISETNNNSRNAAISVWFDDSTGNNHFDIVWEQHSVSSLNSLKHIRISHNFEGTITYSTPNTISKSSYKKNTNASIVSFAESAMVCWLAESFNRFRPLQIKTVIRDALTQGDYYFYDNHTRSTTINKFNDNSGYYFGWSKYHFDEWFNYFVTSDSLSLIRNDFFTSGNEFQLSNSENVSDIDIMAYYHDSSPYYFQTSNLGTSSKEVFPITFIESKGFNFSTSLSDFDYQISNARIDESIIRFNNKSSKNSKNVLLSNPFNLSRHSTLTFDESFDVSEKLENTKLLKSNDFISFKIELVDLSGRLLNSIKELKVSKKNLKDYKTESFTFKNFEIDNVYAKLRVTLDTNLDNINLSQLNYYHVGIKNAENDIIDEVSIIKDFALKQNYPNPFNPLTRIAYQLAKRSKVTIKVYDILGKEVNTLVNEEKDAGKYTAVFDASVYAGGLYIYKMKAGDFSESRKMVLIK